jgi:hypothetical protein
VRLRGGRGWRGATSNRTSGLLESTDRVRIEGPDRMPRGAPKRALRVACRAGDPKTKLRQAMAVLKNLGHTQRTASAIAAQTTAFRFRKSSFQKVGGTAGVLQLDSPRCAAKPS